MPYIAVIGGAFCDEETYALAYEVGKEIALRGGILVCGGLGGVMEAAARGARENGGLSVGILPGEDRFEANQYVTLSIPTGMGEARNVIVVLSADAVIAIDGEYGTLSEIAHALKKSKPVIGLKTWQLYHHYGVRCDEIHIADTPREAVEKAFALAR